MEGKRVFIGLPVDKVLKDAADLFRIAHGGLTVRWIKPENLHLTLVSPWKCENIEPVCAVLKRVADENAAVDVLFDKLSFGPDERRPRLLWATGKAPKALVRLQSMLLDASVLSDEACRPFLLHLTLARFSAKDYHSVPSGRFREPVSWRGSLDTLSLYESILKPDGAEYRQLCRFTLSGFKDFSRSY
jgi:2'-5' RNA ligase